MNKYASDSTTQTLFFDENSTSYNNQSFSLNEVPEFKDKSAIEIAEYLDKQLNKAKMTPPVQANQQPKQQPKQNNFIPLYQSTPVNSSSSVQKETSEDERSKQSENGMPGKQSENGTPDGTADGTPDGTPDGTKEEELGFDTPSKLFQNSSQFTELQELRKLKSFIASLENGDALLKSCRSGGADSSVKICLLDELKAEQDDNASKLNKLHNEINELKTTNDKLTELNNQHASKEKELLLKIDESESEIANLNKKLTQIQGNQADSVTPDRFPIFNQKITSSTNTNTNTTVYEHLQLSAVDLLSLTESKNIIKNILLIFFIPFSEIKAKIPVCATNLKLFSILLSFTNTLHKLVYSADISKEIISPAACNAENQLFLLRSCTNKLLRRIETKLASSR